MEIFNAFLDESKAKSLLHGHSFTGNALACASACASLDLFEREETWKNIQRIEYWNRAMKQVLEGHSKILDVRMLGTILAIELKQSDESSYFSQIRERIVQFFLSKGIFIRPLGNIFFFNPPYCITDEELELVKQTTLEFLAD